MSGVRRQSATTWLALLLLAAGAWALVFLQPWTARSTGQQMASEPEPLLLFLPVWMSMTVAMMFPAVAPVASIFATVSRRRRAAGEAAAPTSLFLSGYLVVWTLFGLAAYLALLVAYVVAVSVPGLHAHAPLVTGWCLIVAGAYQWSTWKQVCLRACRSPLGVIVHGWREGRVGAFSMGFRHGATCIGCCWALMLVLFAVGLMSLIAMLLLTAVIFAERVLPRGPAVGKASSIALLLLGVSSIAGLRVG